MDQTSWQHLTRDEHLFGAGPKRILALDGGGVRGALTLSYLERMEAMLRKRAGGHPDFRLCDYFDLIGGTSTGSIIATGLALGFSVSDLQALYRSLAATVFEKPPYRFGVLVPKFGRQPLIDALAEHFEARTLGHADLLTGLMIMTKRLDTGSPWPLHNNPRGKYYEERPNSKAIANKHFLLTEIVRASTAAPHYFEPERLRVGTDEGRFVEGGFVDGGVSPFNNPSLQLLMLATLEGFHLQWPLGTDKLLVVSVGTGDGEERLSADAVMNASPAMHAVRSLTALMTDCDALVQTMMQWLGKSPAPRTIDSEIGDLGNDTIAGQKWFSYVRYNVTLEGPWLRKQIGFDISDADAAKLRAMDDPGNVDLLERVGTAAAAVQLQPDHFPAAFNVVAAAG